jgi:hypothetical protein
MKGMENGDDDRIETAYKLRTQLVAVTNGKKKKQHFVIYILVLNNRSENWSSSRRQIWIF